MRPGRAKLIALSVLVTAFYALHQDVWNWRKIEPLVFGFLPAGLAYHALYTVAASVVMALLVRFAWPRHLEEVRESPRRNPADSGAAARSALQAPAQAAGGQTTREPGA